MTGAPHDGHCVTYLHMHTGACWRKGWEEGYAAAKAEETEDQGHAVPRRP